MYIAGNWATRLSNRNPLLFFSSWYCRSSPTYSCFCPGWPAHLGRESLFSPKYQVNCRWKSRFLSGLWTWRQVKIDFTQQHFTTALKTNFGSSLESNSFCVIFLNLFKSSCQKQIWRNERKSQIFTTLLVLLCNLVALLVLILCTSMN